MNYRWVSWYHNQETMGSFELHHPWWVSGETFDGSAKTICAAIPTESEKDAEEIVLSSYDKRPANIEWRFNSEKTGSPFSDRFRPSKWMKWPGGASLAGKEKA